MNLNFDGSNFGFDITGITFDYQVPTYLVPKSTGAVESHLDDNYVMDPDSSENIQGSNANISKSLRAVIFNYTHNRAEAVDEFLTLNTLKVLKNDADQIKKVEGNKKGNNPGNLRYKNGGFIPKNNNKKSNQII
jgi:hypothetical protein